MGDMATMPIRELIADMREQVTKMDSADLIKIMFVNVMVSRLEQQADLADEWKEKFEQMEKRHEEFRANVETG